MHAVFLRAANVGGTNVFRPKAFAEAHPELLLRNIGHAGTFVSQADMDGQGLQHALQESLPVDVPMVVVPQADVQALVGEEPVPAEGAKLEVTVLFDDPPASNTCAWPDEEAWEIRLLGVDGRFAVTERRPGGRLSPYKVIEAALGVPGTTRSWSVMEKVAHA